MITEKSSKREIKDLQRLLVATGLMELTNATKDGKWGVETQAAVLRAYSRLGWKHAEDERWISTPALAAVAAMFAEGIGAGGSNIGTSGSNIGTSGSNIGTSGSNIGTSGSNIGTSGSNIGTSGSNIGTSGSNIGGDSTPD